MTKELYLIRHAQSVANAQGRVQGWFDSPLSEQGRQQAQALAERLAAESLRFYAIFSSPLQRAFQTAEIIAHRLDQSPVHPHDCLREYNLGALSGLTFSQIKEKFPACFSAFQKNEPLPPIPDEEGRESFVQRVQTGIDAILAQIPNHQKVLIVTHSGTINACLRGWFMMQTPARRSFILKNGSISVVTVYDGEANKVMVRLNDTCHLDRPL